MTYLLVFAIAATVVVAAGTALARYGDAIAEATGIGRVWIGAVVLAGATSLPELTTGIVAVRLGAPDLAVGDLFGSSMANMLILAIVDLMPPRRRVLQTVTLDHALAACLAITLNGAAAMLVLLRPEWSLGWVAPGSVFLFIGYLAGTRAVYRHSVRDPEPAHSPAAAGPSPASPPASPPASLPAGPPASLPAGLPAMPLRRAATGFAVAALVVFVAAPALAWSAQGIAAITGLGDTFVGTWLVGLATSLPELVACIAAVRMGSFDLAVGNLFGAQALNMAIFLPLDLVQPGSLFVALDPAHAVSGLAAVVLTGLGLAAIVFRAKRRFGMLEPDSVLIVLVYALALWLLYRHSVVA